MTESSFSTEKTENNKKSGISGAALKWIAVITMFIDHVAASFLLYYYRANDLFATHYDVYPLCRYIGRIAFPIYIFLLIEGLQKTRNVRKYLFRLFLFALISEIPFDLAFEHCLWNPDYQNVFFTLFLGLLALCFIRKAEPYSPKCPHLVAIFQLCMLIAAMLIANLLKTDYSYAGVLAIVVMYYLRSNRTLQVIGGCTILFFLSSTSEIFALLALIPIHLYNNTRGKQMKYFFYLFYPVHLVLLWLLGWVI